ncbi:MAG TPA: glycoside hydrolase family 15 protein [Ktedonobacterales bacterium]
MPRDLPLANGALAVNFDATGTLRDIYWPNIGQQNQTLGDLCRLGIWVDGHFAWVNDDGWERTLTYEADTLVTSVTLRHAGLGVSLACADAVDFDSDIFIRKAVVTNEAETPREVRLFYHHSWHLEETEGANTVYFSPSQRALLAYRGKAWMLTAGATGEGAGAPDEHGAPMSQYATGFKGVNGQQGTWRDAEDGSLEGNPITQGSVDGTARYDVGTLAPHGAGVCYSWLCAGPDYHVVSHLDQRVRQRGPEFYLQRTRDYWHLWLTAKQTLLSGISDDLATLYRRSLLTIRTQIDNDGAIIAATDGDVWTFARDSYAYMWPRDGSLVASMMGHAGYRDIAQRFFAFCARVITPQGYIMHKFTPDGALGSSWHPWVDATGDLQLPIQEDETALVIYALWQLYRSDHDVEFVKPYYRPLICAAADFMVGFREPRTKLPAPSWDLWEERHGIHAYTVATVHGGLIAAASFAAAFGESARAAAYQQAAAEIQQAALEHLWSDQLGRYVRTVWVNDDGSIKQDETIDISLAGLFKLGLVDARSARMRATMQAIENQLIIKTPVSGVARYVNDRYHQVSQDIAAVPGNPWFIGALWLAQHMIAVAQSVPELQEALPWMNWVRERALPSGIIAEQVDPMTDAPLSVSPLTWSHAEVVATVRWYAAKHAKLSAAR